MMSRLDSHWGRNDGYESERRIQQVILGRNKDDTSRYSIPEVSEGQTSHRSTTNYQSSSFIAACIRKEVQDIPSHPVDGIDANLKWHIPSFSSYHLSHSSKYQHVMEKSIPKQMRSHRSNFSWLMRRARKEDRESSINNFPRESPELPNQVTTEVDAGLKSKFRFDKILPQEKIPNLNEINDMNILPDIEMQESRFLHSWESFIESHVNDVMIKSDAPTVKISNNGNSVSKEMMKAKPNTINHILNHRVVSFKDIKTHLDQKINTENETSLDYNRHVYRSSSNLQRPSEKRETNHMNQPIGHSSHKRTKKETSVTKRPQITSHLDKNEKKIPRVEFINLNNRPTTPQKIPQRNSQIENKRGLISNIHYYSSNKEKSPFQLKNMIEKKEIPRSAISNLHLWQNRQNSSHDHEGVSINLDPDLKRISSSSYNPSTNKNKKRSKTENRKGTEPKEPNTQEYSFHHRAVFGPTYLSQISKKEKVKCSYLSPKYQLTNKYLRNSKENPSTPGKVIQNSYPYEKLRRNPSYS